MTRTFSAQTVDSSVGRSRNVHRRLRAGRNGFTLVELIVVISILSLFVLLAQVNLFGALRRSQFEVQVQDFISAFRMAAWAAGESSRRYEVIVDIPEQAFVLREITSSNLADVLDEEIIAHGYFADNCQIAYVEFDDGAFTNDSPAKFRAGHAGWQYGGKVVFLDSSEQPYAVVVSRLTTNVELVKGDPELMTPKAKDEVPFL
jgi:prepilin-type N-terminal cleavage/methylation domain-containing protein